MAASSVGTDDDDQSSMKLRANSTILRALAPPTGSSCRRLLPGLLGKTLERNKAEEKPLPVDTYWSLKLTNLQSR